MEEGDTGCIDSNACNFDETAICGDNSCTYEGCTNPLASNYDETAGCDDGSCIIEGCTILIACNYEPTANIDDDSCYFDCPGCTEQTAFNYNPFATEDDGSCFIPQPEVNISSCGGGIAIYTRHGSCENNWNGVDPICIADEACIAWGFYSGALSFEVTTDGNLYGDWNLGDFSENGSCTPSYWDFCYAVNTNEACNISHGVYNIVCVEE